MASVVLWLRFMGIAVIYRVRIYEKFLFVVNAFYTNLTDGKISRLKFLSSIFVLLRSEIPSGICAKLRTVAASNNRVHMPWSLSAYAGRYVQSFTSYYRQSFHATITLLLLVRATYIYGVVLHAHPVRGESHNQRNTTGEVATVVRLCISAVGLDNLWNLNKYYCLYCFLFEFGGAWSFVSEGLSPPMLPSWPWDCVAKLQLAF